MHGAPTGKIKKNGEMETVYDVVLEHLIREQGGLCAYCMRRIPERRGNPPVTIEHIDPQYQ